MELWIKSWDLIFFSMINFVMNRKDGGNHKEYSIQWESFLSTKRNLMKNIQIKQKTTVSFRLGKYKQHLTYSDDLPYKNRMFFRVIWAFCSD